MSVIKTCGAPFRVVLDSFRPILVWIVALTVHWECFSLLQLGALVMQLLGAIIYVRGDSANRSPPDPTHGAQQSRRFMDTQLPSPLQHRLLAHEHETLDTEDVTPLGSVDV